MCFHSGEIAVQTRAGVRAEAEKISKVISNIIQPAALEFISTQQMAIASTIAADGSVWAALITGIPGFIQGLDESTIQVDLYSQKTNLDEGKFQACPLHWLSQNLDIHSQIGLLIIDLSNRKRLRLNGEIRLKQSGKLKIQVQESFFNCPKYIQTRHLEKSAIASLPSPKVSTRSTLNPTDRCSITQADTFFIATAHSTRGADTSHRGGNPGFVRILNSQTLLFPDYAGNNMFQTLGNLAVNPKAGLLFIDFERGHTLQLTGQAIILWETEQLITFKGARRLVQFTIDRIVESQNITPLRWKFGEYSSANPG